MKTKSSIIIGNKCYPYTLERTGKQTVRVVAKGACIIQEFLSEDVSELILDLPHLILAEQAHEKKQSDVVRFRISGRDQSTYREKST